MNSNITRHPVLADKSAPQAKALGTIRYGLVLAIAFAITTNSLATVYIESRSSSLAQASPQGLSSHAIVQNGVVPVGGNNVAGPNGSSSAGPSGIGVTTAFANTTQIDGAVLTNNETSASLALANLSVLAQAGATPGVGFTAALSLGIPKWTETITFNNTKATPVELDIFWDTDGSVVDTGGPAVGSIDIRSSIEVQIVNDANWKDVHLKGGPAFYMGGAQFNYSKVSGSSFSFQPNGNNSYNAWTTTAVGSFSGLIKATLVLPPGVVSITISTFLSVDCRGSAVCDYVNGAKFTFGTLPGGLTWTSESGVFLSAVTPAPTDSDGDGTPDSTDGCPNDALKTAAGLCGCGVADADNDGDGVCDATDNCADVANADQADTNSDGVGDACTTPPADLPQVDMPCGTGVTCGTLNALALLPMAPGFMLMRRRKSARR